MSLIDSFKNISERIVYQKIDKVRGLKTSSGDARIGVFFDMDGVLVSTEAMWIIKDIEVLQDALESSGSSMELTPEEIATNRISQERGAEAVKELDVPDITKYFNFSEFRSQEHFRKQAKEGSVIEEIANLLIEHVRKGHVVYILTARGNYRGIKKEFGETMIGDHISKFNVNNPFAKKGSVYAVNDDQFIGWWARRIGITRSAHKKAAIIQSFLKYKEGEMPSLGWTDVARIGYPLALRKWRDNHPDRLFDRVYFYDDEAPNILAVERMLQVEKDKLLYGKNTIISNHITNRKVEESMNSLESLKQGLKENIVDLNSTRDVKEKMTIKDNINRIDEALFNLIFTSILDEGVDSGKAKVSSLQIKNTYAGKKPETVLKDLKGKFSYELLEMASDLGLQMTRDESELIEMIYEKVTGQKVKLIEMARAGETVIYNNKKAIISKGNRGRNSKKVELQGYDGKFILTGVKKKGIEVVKKEAEDIKTVAKKATAKKASKKVTRASGKSLTAGETMMTHPLIKGVNIKLPIPPSITPQKIDMMIQHADETQSEFCSRVVGSVDKGMAIIDKMMTNREIVKNDLQGKLKEIKRNYEEVKAHCQNKLKQTEKLKENMREAAQYKGGLKKYVQKLIENAEDKDELYFMLDEAYKSLR